VPPGEIRAGDLVRVRPGERLPVDGVVTEGRGVVDESMLTGESMPAEKFPGSKVIVATINGTGALLVRAGAVGEASTLARMIRMVSDAQRAKAPIQRLADRVSAVFVPVVLAVAVITFLAWALVGGSLQAAFLHAIAVLVVACPCALGLATPMSLMVGIGRGAQAGVLIRDPASIERAARANRLVTDKTGTLTDGKPAVAAVRAVRPGDEARLLAIAASVEAVSEHPLAQAIVAAARDQSLSIQPTTEFESRTGEGVRANVAAAEVRVGKRAFAAPDDITPQLANAAMTAEADAKTVVWVSVGNELLGWIAAADPIKPTAQSAVAELLGLGIETTMATGDNPRTADAIGRAAGIASIHAGLLPADKAALVRDLQSKGGIVLMAGDGINDAPALAAADAGIAMSTGTDVAMQAAGITLVHGDLRGIARAVRLSRAILRNIRQNLFFAFIYNFLSLPIAAGVLVPITGWSLSPMLAAAAMSASSLCVIANSLRLRTCSRVERF